MHLKQAQIVISGASSGLGAALSLELARRGAHVVLLARTAEALAELTHTIANAGGTAHWYAVDLSNLQEAEQITAQIRQELGTPDVLINNAGIGRFLAVDETTPPEAMAMMMLPYGAAFALTHGFLPAMLERRQGLIVNITSPASRLAWPGATAYAVARWAMRGFNSALQADLRGTGVRAMLVTPGKISSTYFSNNPGSEERIPWIAKLIPTWTPEQVARAIADALEADKRELVVPGTAALFLPAAALLPAQHCLDYSAHRLATPPVGLNCFLYSLHIMWKVLAHFHE